METVFEKVDCLSVADGGHLMNYTYPSRTYQEQPFLKTGFPRTGSIGCFTDGPISEQSQLATAKELIAGPDLDLLLKALTKLCVVCGQTFAVGRRLNTSAS
jgi:hypothetical protein